MTIDSHLPWVPVNDRGTYLGRERIVAHRAGCRPTHSSLLVAAAAV